MKRSAWFATVAFAATVSAIVAAQPALAGPASISFSVDAGGAVKFNSIDRTSTALPAGGPMTATVTVTTNNAGGGQVWIVSPANPLGAGGARLDLSTITVTCVDEEGNGWLNGGSATLVPGGHSAACATISPNVLNQNTRMTITFTMDVRNAIADTWSATSGFSLGGSAF
jgi:hypothetical protein